MKESGESRIGNYPEWICYDCGEKHGRQPISFHAKGRSGVCEICCRSKTVTETYNYGWLKVEWRRCMTGLERTLAEIEKEKILKAAHYKGDIAKLDDGYYHFFASSRGGMSSWVLRTIADELDRLNKGWDDQVREYFGHAVQKEVGKDRAANANDID